MSSASPDRLMRSNASGERFVLAHDSAISLSESLLDSLLEQASQYPTAFTVVPVGEAGHFQWKRLPLEIATLACNPLNSSLVVISSENSASTETGDQIWQALIKANSDQIQVLESEEMNQIEIQYPLLAPTDTSPAKWLQSCLDEQPTRAIRSQADAIAVKAGLYQMQDALHRSHSFSQSIEGEGPHRAGDYWHAIMHRREPDYGNSKYWFRHVGQHPLFTELGSIATRILEGIHDADAVVWKSKLCRGGWDPFAFVDLAQHCSRDETTPLAQAARKIQWIEMLLLLEHTYEDACDIS